MSSIEESIATIMREASSEIAEEVIDHATNMFGKLGPDVRERLLAVIRDPNAHTWDNAYSIILNSEIGMGRTLWQAVLKLDRAVNASASMDAPVEDRWQYVPQPITIIMAISAAVAERGQAR